MKRRSEGGPRGSAEGENPIPAQPTKLRDEVPTPSIDKNKEKDYVEDSPTTHLTKVEATQDSQTQLQLKEKNTLPAWLKEDILPKDPPIRIVAKPPQMPPSSCVICTKPGHWPNQCPWRKQIPYGVTQVGKGYGFDGRRAFRLNCAYCDETGTHRLGDCPDWNKLLKETGGDVPLPSWLLVDVPPADS
ncbi:hypothetical protein ACFX1X_039229 [Malus domestica]